MITYKFLWQKEIFKKQSIQNKIYLKNFLVGKGRGKDKMMVCIIEGKLVIKTEEEDIEVTLKDHDTDKVIDLEFIEA